MLTILLRTVLIYVFLMIIMRLMGKRQIGELEVSDLVTTLLLSEIASLPITETSLPLSYAIIPMITLLTFEVLSSLLMARFPALKGFASARPTMLICNGKIDRRAMLSSRLSLDELMGELRQKDVSDLSEVRYAILEQSGKITVIQNADAKPPSSKDLGITPKDCGLDHILISEGRINSYNLRFLGKSRSALLALLNRQGIRPQEVYLMLCDDAGNVKLIRREDMQCVHLSFH